MFPPLAHPRPAHATGALLVIILLAPPLASAQFPPDSFTNLHVLPANIGTRELVDLMAGFTRALGVRCTHCHVGEEDRPLATYDFPSDDKAAKRKARAMLEMVRDINDRHLAGLEERAAPAVEATCATCHGGVTTPRPIEDIVVQTYETEGLDAAVRRYRELRGRYYGRAAYDFGSVPLTAAAERVGGGGALADAVALLALNVEFHPEDRFAQRLHAGAAVRLAMTEGGVATGTARFQDLLAAYGPEAFPPFVLNGTGRQLLRAGRLAGAVAVFRFGVDLHPDNPTVHESLGDVLLAAGDTVQAVASYEHALRLDPANANAARALERLGRSRR